MCHAIFSPNPLKATKASLQLGQRATEVGLQVGEKTAKHGLKLGQQATRIGVDSVRKPLVATLGDRKKPTMLGNTGNGGTYLAGGG